MTRSRPYLLLLPLLASLLAALLVLLPRPTDARNAPAVADFSAPMPRDRAQALVSAAQQADRAQLQAFGPALAEL
ncbi:MAG TPA: hypothetical protein PKK15_25360, partial [Kouleothrix sp.]|nr:hypothetical protein [Kouleothrix sp.]